jgi:hypothetical protein
MWSFMLLRQWWGATFKIVTKYNSSARNSMVFFFRQRREVKQRLSHSDGRDCLFLIGTFSSKVALFVN